MVLSVIRAVCVRLMLPAFSALWCVSVGQPGAPWPLGSGARPPPVARCGLFAPPPPPFCPVIRRRQSNNSIAAVDHSLTPTPVVANSLLSLDRQPAPANVPRSSLGPRRLL